MDEANIRFKEMREKLGISQKELGDRLGLSNSGISNIEKGIRSVTDKHIKLLSATFNANEQWLRNGTGEMFIQTDSSVICELAKSYGLGKFDETILKLFCELPLEQRKAFKTFAFSLVDAVLNDEVLYSEYRENVIEENATSYAARNGDSNGLKDLVDDFDSLDD